jgi:hypothetical protein
MSETVAVTLITAVSTLAGAGISGYVAFLVSRAQSKTQIEITRSEQIEQRLTDRRQLRKDAYSQFLNRVVTAEELLEILWQLESKDSLRRDKFREMSSAIVDIRRSADVVALEGPAHVTSLAEQLWVTIMGEFSILVDNLSEAPDGIPLWKHCGDIFKEAVLNRGKSKSNFISAAQNALNDVSDSTSSQRHERDPAESPNGSYKLAMPAAGQNWTETTDIEQQSDDERTGARQQSSS